MSDFGCIAALMGFAWSVTMLVLMFVCEHRLTRIQRMMEDDRRKPGKPPAP